MPVIAHVRRFDLSLRKIWPSYQRNGVANGIRERAQDVDSWIQPLCQLFIYALRFIEKLDLTAEHGDNGIWIVAKIQLGG